MFIVAVKTGIALGWLLSQCRGEEPGIGPDGQYAVAPPVFAKAPDPADEPKPIAMTADQGQSLLSSIERLSDRIDQLEAKIAQQKSSVVVNPPKPMAQAEKPVAKTAETQVIDWHSHRCPHDGTTWRHDSSFNGSEEAHRCPLCHRVQWDKQEEHVAIPVTTTEAKPITIPVKKTVVYQTQVQSNCPGGVCPAQGKVVFRWFR
jgi:hypothetical protein